MMSDAQLIRGQGSMFSRIMREAWFGLRRNASMVVSIVLVTFISLLFVGSAGLLQAQVTKMKSYWYDKAQVAVYLCTDTHLSERCGGVAATDAQIKAVKTQLESEALKPYVKKVYFETKDEAYKHFKEQFKGSNVLDYVSASDLSPTYWVNLNDPSKSDVITETFSQTKGVDSVVDQRSYLDRIFAVLNGASFAAVTVAVLMLVSAVLLISTTIRLSAFTRRKELGIMRLVGASNSFIRLPFILEGVVAALIGSVLAGGVLVLIVKVFVQGYLAKNLSVALIGMPQALLMWPVLVVIGVGLAALASAVAIRRYLRI